MSDFSDERPKTESTPPVEIPASSLSPDALGGILENFILREGTDYGTQEVGYDAKVERVRKQLERGDVKIIFDPDSESVTLMTKREWEKASQARE